MRPPDCWLPAAGWASCGGCTRSDCTGVHPRHGSEPDWTLSTRFPFDSSSWAACWPAPHGGFRGPLFVALLSLVVAWTALPDESATLVLAGFAVVSVLTILLNALTLLTM